MIIEQCNGSQPIIISDSKSRLLIQGDPTAFHTRITYETRVEVNINIPAQNLAKALVKLLTEELGSGSGYHG